MLKYFIISDEMRTFMMFAILVLTALVYSKIHGYGKWLSDRFFRNRDLVKEAKEIAAEKAPVGLLVIDEYGKVLSSNLYVEEIFRWHEKDILGNNIQVLFSPVDYEKINGLKRLHSAAEDNTTIELSALDKRNKIIPIEVSVSKNEAIEYTFYVISLRDISHRKNNELQRRLLDDDYRQDCELLRLGEIVGNIGSFKWDLTKDPDELIYSEQYAKIFDIPYGNKIQAIALMEVIHIDDREMVNAVMKNAIENAIDYDITHRVVRRNKSVDLVRCIAECGKNENGVTICLNGVAQLIKANVE